MKPYKELLSLLKHLEKVGDSLALFFLTFLALLAQSVILFCSIWTTTFVILRRLVERLTRKVARKRVPSFHLLGETTNE